MTERPNAYKNERVGDVYGLGEGGAQKSRDAPSVPLR